MVICCWGAIALSAVMLYKLDVKQTPQMMLPSSVLNYFDLENGDKGVCWLYLVEVI